MAALDEIAATLGEDMRAWSWGRLHALPLKHVLSGRGELGKLLDRGGLPAPGDSTTVCNMAPDPSYAAYLGPTYRMVADLTDQRQGMWSVGVAGNSGHPGSPHYDDQILPWNQSGYHYVPLRDAASSRPTLTLEPAS